MKIKELKLYNFGVFAGENIFEFVSDKPIVLVGGMNGRGKTTFLRRFYFLYMEKILLRIKKAGLNHMDNI